MKNYIKILFCLNLLHISCILEAPPKRQKYPIPPTSNVVVDDVLSEIEDNLSNHELTIHPLEKAKELIDENDAVNITNYLLTFPNLFSDPELLKYVEEQDPQKLIRDVFEKKDLFLATTPTKGAPTPYRPGSAKSFSPSFSPGQTPSDLSSSQRQSSPLQFKSQADLSRFLSEQNLTETTTTASPVNQSFVKQASSEAFVKQASSEALSISNSPNSALQLDISKIKISELIRDKRSLMQQLPSIFNELPDKRFDKKISFMNQMVDCNMQHIYWGDLDRRDMKFTGGHTMQSIKRLEFLGLITVKQTITYNTQGNIIQVIYINNITNVLYTISIFPDGWNPEKIELAITTMNITKEMADEKDPENILKIRGLTKENFILEVIYNKKTKNIITAYPIIIT